MRLGIKLGLLFLALSIFPLASVGYLANKNGSQTIKNDSINHIVSITEIKEAEFIRWLEDKKDIIELLASVPRVGEYASVITTNDFNSLEHQDARTDLLETYLLPNLEKDGRFLDFSLLHPEQGIVLLSTNPSGDGTFLENEEFFIAGKYETSFHIGASTDSHPGPAIHISTPIRDRKEVLVSVLIGRLNFSEITAIMNQGSDISSTQETYMVNQSNLFVTDSRFEHGYPLKQTASTEGVSECLAHKNGFGLYEDYRGVPVIGAYRWIGEMELCIITEVDQAEAFAPILESRDDILAAAGIIVILTITLGGLVTRKFTQPIKELIVGTRHVGRGNLDFQIPLSSGDEIGQLGEAFNEMTFNLKQSMGETAHGQRLLLVLSEASQSVQRALTQEEVYRTLGDEITSLGFHAVMFALSDDSTYLTISHMTFESTMLRAAEKLAGFDAKDYRVEIGSGSFYDPIILEKRTVFTPSISDRITETVPKVIQPISRRVTRMLGLEQGIYAPLVLEGETRGILVVCGKDISEVDVNAVTTFANQTAIALENAHLHQKELAWAAELEQRVKERSEALVQSEEMFRSAFDHAAIGRAIAAPDGHFLKANNTLCKLTGFTEEELLSKTWSELTHPDFLEPSFENVQRLFNGEIPSFHLEIQLLHKDGFGVWASLNVVLIRDPEGHPLQMIGDIEDISSRKYAEDALRSSETRLTKAQRIAHIGNWEWNIETDELTWSDEIYRIFGLAPQEFGATYEAFINSVHPDDRQFVNRSVDAALYEHKPYKIEHRILLPTGEERIVEEQGEVSSNLAGEPIRMLGTVQDITDRKRVEEELERRLKEQTELREAGAIIASSLEQNKVVARIAEIMGHAVDATSAYICSVDPVSRTSTVLADSYGPRASEEEKFSDIGATYDLENEFEGTFELLNNRITEVVHWDDPDISSTERDHMLEFGAKTTLFIPLEVGGAVQAYAELWESERKREFSEEEIDLCQAIAQQAALAIQNSQLYEQAQTELSERKRVEEEIRLLNEELEQRVLDRTEELEAAMSELESFSFSVSHDLRAPLRAIDGFSRILVDEYMDKMPKEAMHYISTVRNNAQRMSQLIEDLLAFSRLGRQPLEMRRSSIEEVIDLALEDLRSDLDDRDIELRRGDLPECLADPALLKLVFVNLLGNAIKFTRGREVAQVEIGSTFDPNSPHEVTLFIKDNGVGFDMRYANKLFSVFQRLHRDEDFEGTGVGLANVQRIIQRHGGRIWAEAEVDVGATFFFTLPTFVHILKESEEIEQRIEAVNIK